MSVINTFTATPNRILITFEYLNSLGEIGEKRKHLENQIHVGRDKTIVNEVLSEMKNLNLTESDQGKVKLKKELLKSSSTKTELSEFFYEILLQKLTNDSEAKECKQEEVASYLALLLCMNPYAPMQWSGDEFSKRKTKLLKEEIKLLEDSKNQALLQNLVYWSKYLGFISYVTDKYFVPDPTNVISKNLPSIIDSKKIESGEFHSRLGAHIQVLEGGKVRKEIESKLNVEFQREENHFSRSTSLALKRLDTRGVIKLKKLSDGEDWILDLGKVKQNVSHIEYKKGN